MTKLVELIGSLAPVAVLVILFAHRRRTPVPAALGMAGAALAGAGSLAELVSSRAVWFGGGAEGALERLEGWGLLRFTLVMAGIVLLSVAALAGQGRTVPRIPLTVTGIFLAAAGCATRFVHVDLDDETSTVLVTMAIEVVQFALLGLAVLMIGIAVISGRDEGPEPLGQAARMAGRIARAIQETRTHTGQPASRVALAGAVLAAIRESVAEHRSEAGTAAPPNRRRGHDADGR